MQYLKDNSNYEEVVANNNDVIYLVQTAAAFICVTFAFYVCYAQTNLIGKITNDYDHQNNQFQSYELEL